MDNNAHRLTAWSLIACTMLLASCARRKPTVAEMLKNRGLQNSFYACLMNGIAQHLPLAQIQKDCETKLTLDGKGGLSNPKPDLGPAGRNETAFDPASLQAVCASGDPGRGAGPGGANPGGGTKPGTGTKLDTNGGRGTKSSSGRDFVEATTVHGNKYFFPYTWGRKGETSGYKTDDKGQVGLEYYKGLSKEEAKKQQEDAVNAYLKALKEYDDLVKQQTSDLEEKGKAPWEWQNDPKMQKAREAAFKKFVDAEKKANEDQNVGGFGGGHRPAPSSPCNEALQAAREIVGQCQMSEWKSGPCQRLLARIQGCPDPALVYVDPEQGYVCRPAIDPAAVRQAWTDRCQQLKRPNPGGPDPCVPPQVDSNSRYITPTKGDQTCGGPQVYVTPDTSNPDRSCVHELNLPSFEKTTHQIYVWGLKNLGGPIVVFGPRPGTDPPSPGPRPVPSL